MSKIVFMNNAKSLEITRIDMHSLFVYAIEMVEPRRLNYYGLDFPYEFESLYLKDVDLSGGDFSISDTELLALWHNLELRGKIYIIETLDHIAINLADIKKPLHIGDLICLIEINLEYKTTKDLLCEDVVYHVSGECDILGTTYEMHIERLSMIHDSGGYTVAEWGRANNAVIFGTYLGSEYKEISDVPVIHVEPIVVVDQSN